MNRRHRQRWDLIAAFVLAAVVFLVTGGLARGDDNGGVTLTVSPEHVGLGGLVRPGAWTPMLVTLENHLATPLRVRIQWVLPDADGDEVQPQRVVTLSPQRVEQAWLYAAPTVMLRVGPGIAPWVVKVIDDATGELLASQKVAVAQDQIISPFDRAIGITSTLGLGLEPFEEAWTQNEATRFIRGFDVTALPDRWYGLSAIDSLVWTPDASNGGGDPGSPAISTESRQALFEWIRRGGHLVIILPATGDLWSNSPFKDLLGGLKMRTLTEVPAPLFLGSPMRDPLKIDVKWLEAGPDGMVVLRDERGRALAVTRQYGFGRVSVVGVDLTDPRLRKMGLPSSLTVGFPRSGEMLWSTLFNWRGPSFSQTMIDGEKAAHHILDPVLRLYVELDRYFIAHHVDMRAATGTPLLLAIIFFFLYLFAVPISYAVLKRRGRVHQSWTVFVVIVLVCTAVAWGGALVLRPTHESAAHFTLLDADASTGMIHAHSWLSLYAPVHGTVDVSIDPDSSPGTGNIHNTIAAPGLSPEQASAGFLDSQRYSIDAANPDHAPFPFRATAKQVEVDYLAHSAGGDASSGETWAMPSGAIHVENGWPRGKLSHGLPGTLTNVIVIFNPGDGREPWVWPWLNEWPPGATVELLPPKNANRLVVPPPDPTGEWGGYLGGLLRTKPGQSLSQLDPSAEVNVSSDQTVTLVEMLTFYNTLPPPQFAIKSDSILASAVGYHRSLGRVADLSGLLQLRRVIIIGHLENSPLPVPLRIDGHTVSAKGWTTVRWISPIEE